ncbi:MAG: PAS domain-containing protein, partial [Lachnospiraceae bacterium]|nr:PAS domain-containing protein [Lachnospiraceae bacterium]
MRHKTFEWKPSERAIIERMPVLMLVFQYWPDKKKLILATDECCDTFRQTKEQLFALFNEKSRTILHPDDDAKYRSVINHLQEDQSEAFELTMRIRASKSKNYRWFRVRLRADRADEDSIVVYAVHSDINDVQEEMRLTEEESARTDNLLENILNIAPVSIFWKDTKRKFLGAN